MKYFAKDLQSVYEILETLPKPLAVLDFMCGAVGGEFTVTQSLGGQFYDKWNRDARVVALCWEGATILYSNISDDQIEFTNKEVSMLGNKDGKGYKKKYWLKKRGHRYAFGTIAGIVARCGPVDVSAKGMRKWYGMDHFKQWEMIRERLTRTGHVFSTGNPPLIQEPYVAIFDRNERIAPWRNTCQWQVELFRRWAKSFGFKLVVISDFYPRRWEDVICVSFADRNLSRLCNIIRHAILYASPSSGVSDMGMIFGCDFAHLVLDPNDIWPTFTKILMPPVLEGRGFRYFGILDTPDGEVANNVKEYLEEKRVV